MEMGGRWPRVGPSEGGAGGGGWVGVEVGGEQKRILGGLAPTRKVRAGGEDQRRGLVAGRQARGGGAERARRARRRRGSSCFRLGATAAAGRY